MNTKQIASQEFLQKLNESYHFCELAAKDSNFYMGILLSGKSTQKALFSIYAWFRAIDDIVDDTHSSNAEKKTRLHEFLETTYKVLEDNNFAKSLGSLWLAFRNTIIRYHIPKIYLQEMIAGQEKDLLTHDYKTFAELYGYCRQVAAMVGLMCIYIWGFKGGMKTEQMAEWCGIAFQLTNILRDVVEDLQVNRVYLPAEFFDLSELTADQLKKLPMEQLLQGVQKIIDKANKYYQKSLGLYEHIDEAGRLSFLIMFNYYYAIFEKIRKNPKLIFLPQQIKLSKLEKFLIISSAFVNHKLLHKTF